MAFFGLFTTGAGPVALGLLGGFILVVASAAWIVRTPRANPPG